MLDSIRTKVRALIEDFTENDVETFEFTNASIFTLAESNIGSITKVLKNGVVLGSGDYSYDSVTDKIDITTTLINGDIIEVDYAYQKYSDTELNEYVRAAIVWISIFSFGGSTDYEIEDGDIYPTPDNKTLDLISIISAIIIKPDYSSYSLSNIKVVYPSKMSKEERIEKLIQRFNSGLGVTTVLTF